MRALGEPGAFVVCCMSEYIEIQGIKIAYKVSGAESDVPVAVILQGWGTDYSLYDPIADLIGDRYRVVQFDLPGFGASGEPKEPWNVENYADFFVEFLRALKINECMLIGHSYGGRIILKLTGDPKYRNRVAATDAGDTGDGSFQKTDVNDPGKADPADSRDPITVDRLILIDAAGILPVRTAAQKRRQLSYKILKKVFANKLIYWLFREIIDDWRSRQGSEDYRRASDIMKGTLVKSVNEDLTYCLSNIKQDTLLIWGENDTATPVRDAHIMDEKIPNSGLAVIPGTGHFSYAGNPELFGQIVNAYLNDR